MKAYLLIYFCIGLSVFYKTSFCYNECKDPGPKNNLRFSRISNSLVHFSCPSGYVLHGNQTSFCEKGRWTPAGQFCEAYWDVPGGWMGCGSPGFPANGSRYIEIMTENKLHYACKKGFIQIGESERTCQPDGTWAPNISQCVINLALNKKAIHEPFYKPTFYSTDGKKNTCKTQTTNFYGSVDFENIVSFNNIQVVYSKVDLNEIHVYVTNHSDVAKIYFQNTKSLLKIYNNTYKESTLQQISLESTVARYLVFWFKKQTSICEIIVFNSKESGCGKPDAPFNGKTLKYDSKIATYACKFGFLMRGEQNVFCKNGVWDRAAPKCVPIEPSVGRPRASPRLNSHIPKDPQNDENASNSTTIAIAVLASLASVCLISMTLYYKFKRNRELKSREQESQKNILEHEEYDAEQGPSAQNDVIYENSNVNLAHPSKKTSATVNYVEVDFEATCSRNCEQDSQKHILKHEVCNTAKRSTGNDVVYENSNVNTAHPSKKATINYVEVDFQLPTI